MLLRKLTAMGIELTDSGPAGSGPTAGGRIHSVDVATLPYPGFATDYKPLLVTMLTVADGVGIVTENLFVGRFRYVDELRRMGADVRTEGHHAVVRGVERLSGAPVRAFDVRAGAALVLAGLAADGETVIADAHHVDRGYEDLDRQAQLPRRKRRPDLTPRTAPGILGCPCPARNPPIPPPCSRPPAMATGWPCPVSSRWSNGAAPHRARAVAGLAYRDATAGLHGRDHRRPRLGQVDPHRPAHRPGTHPWPRRERPGGGAGRRPLVPVLRWGDPRRPDPDAGPRPRREGLHPLDGHPRPPGRPDRGGARRDPGASSVRGSRWCWSRRSGSVEQEVSVAAATDTTIVVLNPGWGDAIQANKAGLLEIADLFVINKADRPGRARRAATSSSCSTSPSSAPGARRSSRRWPPPVTGSRRCGPPSPSTGRRSSRTAPWRCAADGGWHASSDQILLALVEQEIDDLLAADRFAATLTELSNGTVDPYEAADRLLSALFPTGGPGGG